MPKSCYYQWQCCNCRKKKTILIVCNIISLEAAARKIELHGLSKTSTNMDFIHGDVLRLATSKLPLLCATLPPQIHLELCTSFFSLACLAKLVTNMEEI